MWTEVEKMEEAVQLMDAVEGPLDTACKLTSLLLISQGGGQMWTIDMFLDNCASLSSPGDEIVKRLVVLRRVVLFCVVQVSIGTFEPRGFPERKKKAMSTCVRTHTAWAATPLWLCL